MKTLLISAVLCMAASGNVLAQNSQVITERPAGEVHSNLYRMSNSYFDAYYYVGQQTSDGCVGEYVVADNGDIYIKDPVWLSRTNSYVKLTRQADGSYVLKGHQPVLETTSNGKTSTYYLDKMSWEYDYESWEYTLKPTSGDANQMVFTLDNDTLHTSDNAVLGITDSNGNWTNYGDNYVTFFPQKDKVNELPAGIAASPYRLQYENNNVQDVAAMVGLYEDGNNVYMVGFSRNIRGGGVLKGARTAEGLSFEPGQYIGIDTVNAVHVYFTPAKAFKSFSTVYKRELVDSVRPTQQPFTFTLKNGVYVSNDSAAIVLNKGYRYFGALTTYIAPETAVFNEMAGTPKNPEFTKFEAYNASLKRGYAYVNLYDVDTDGHYMNPDKLYYNLYIDGKKLTLTPDVYHLIKTDMTDIPYQYNDQYDVQYNGADHKVYFYTADMARFGVQLVYTGGNETHASDIVYWDLAAGTQGVETPTGIKGLSAAASDKAAIYTLSGVKTGTDASRLPAGIYIRGGKKFVVK